MRRDLACALTLLGLAALYYALARDLGQTALSDAVGPAGLPRIYATVLAVLAVLLGIAAVVAARRRPRRDAPSAPAARTGVERREIALSYRVSRASGTLAIGLVYLAIVAIIGYVLATALAIAAMAIYQGERASWRLAIVAAVGAAALYALFDLVLGVPLPAPWNA